MSSSSTGTGIKGISRAEERGYERGKDILVMPLKDYPSSVAWGEAIIEECRKRGIDLWGQYGWLLPTPASVIEYFGPNTINQHPGGLRYKRLGFGGQYMHGAAVHAAVLWFARNVGREFPCTEAVAQRVSLEYDGGAVLYRQEVPIKKLYGVGDLQEAVLPVEHEVQVETLLQFANRTVKELDLSDLILPGEEEMLAEAKKVAHILYPNG